MASLLHGERRPGPPSLSVPAGGLSGAGSAARSARPRSRPRSAGRGFAQPLRSERGRGGPGAARAERALPAAPTERRGRLPRGGRTRVPPGRARLRPPPPPPRPWWPARGRLRPGRCRCVPRSAATWARRQRRGLRGWQRPGELGEPRSPPTRRASPERRRLPLLPAPSAAPA